ncbi:MAG: 3D (Asp-Asp-Asp) domain-containing protein [Verrucomicrobiales bacterium]|jgi:3D (Asp-Asp-Asp) domain-containing protein
MQSSNPPKFTAKSALIAAVCLCVLPSCAIKRLADRDQAESAAANAKSLEDALAILDQAIEETAPASEINSIPLDVPAYPEDMEPAKPDHAPVIELITANGDELTSTDTLFEIETDPIVTAAAEEAIIALPAVEEEPAKLREHVVVKRPSPNYSTFTKTTQAIDEFRKVRTTAYCHTEADHIKYGELSAKGKPLLFGMVRSAAADWSIYPVGTRFRIVGKPYEYVIDDYGSALVGTGTIDLYKPSGDRMDDWGVREVEIEVIAWGSFGKSLEILEPRKEMGEHIGQMISAITDRPEEQVVAAGGTDASIRPYE